MIKLQTGYIEFYEEEQYGLEFAHLCLKESKITIGIKNRKYDFMKYTKLPLVPNISSSPEGMYGHATFKTLYSIPDELNTYLSFQSTTRDNAKIVNALKAYNVRPIVVGKNQYRTFIFYSFELLALQMGREAEHGLDRHIFNLSEIKDRIKLRFYFDKNPENKYKACHCICIPTYQP